jgi:hypothetical protein
MFRIDKIPVESLISLLMELYENGADYVDMSSDNSVPGQDRLIIQTRDEYMNPEMLEGRKREKNLPATTTETTTIILSEDSINDLL